MKYLPHIFKAFLFSVSFVACATQGPPLKTASGRPEVLIAGVAPQKVRAVIIDRGAAHGWTLERETDNSIAFTKRTDNVMASVLVGSAYDPNVIDRVRFTTIALNGGTKVYASEEFVSNHGSAFEKVTPLQNNTNSNNLQRMLESIKATFATKEKAPSATPESSPSSATHPEPSAQPAGTPQ